MRPVRPHGLPIQVSLVDGEIVFLGEGAVGFSMTLEAAQQTFHNLAEALISSRTQQPTQQKSRVILVVEDEPMLREVAAALLEDAGYAVILAEGPTAALSTLESGAEVHLLFTDVQMPGELNGFQLANLVRDRWPAIPLLVTSGQARPSQDSLPAGGRFLPKPYVAEDVLRHITELTTA